MSVKVIAMLARKAGAQRRTVRQLLRDEPRTPDPVDRAPESAITDEIICAVKEQFSPKLRAGRNSTW
jgi:hypothetical protein